MVNVGQNWRLDCNKSRHSEAVLVPGRSIDTVSFCGWAPCHAEDALCENTSCKMPSSRMGNFFFFFSNAFVTCVRYHGNRNGHSTSLGKRQKEDDGVIKKRTNLYSEKCHMSGKPNTCCAASKGQKQPST